VGKVGKDEIDYYFRAVAATGFCVVAIGYSPVPESTYPTPVRQALAALDHVQNHAERLGADPSRILLSGDPAGSHISAQVAAAVTSPEYARKIGVIAPISPDQSRAVVLCCGIYDFATAATDNLTPAFPPAFLTVGNVDPLRTQTEGLLAALKRAGVQTEMLGYATDHQPPLSHEYQFDLGLADGRMALERITDFLHRHTALIRYG
jgi:acetyl esterase/lipase